MCFDDYSKYMHKYSEHNHLGNVTIYDMLNIIIVI